MPFLSAFLQLLKNSVLEVNHRFDDGDGFLNINTFIPFSQHTPDYSSLPRKFAQKSPDQSSP
jgi:hypothetical protein